MKTHAPMNTEGLSQEEIALFSEIRDAIDAHVHDKVSKELKLQPSKIDEASIEEECTREIFQEMATPLAIAMEDVVKFTQLLKVEDEKAYEELASQVSPEDLKKSLSKKDTTFNDLIEFSKKHAASSELLDKIYLLGLNHYQSGENEKAFLYFNWLCTADADNAQVWFLKGLIEESLGKFQDAIVTHYMAMSLDPTMLQVYPQLISCFLLTGDIATAKSLYDIFTAEINVNDMKDDPLLQDNIMRIKERLERRSTVGGL